MKLKNLLFGLAIMLGMVIVGCDDDDVKNIPTEITTFITQQYGSDAYVVECEKERNGNYDVEIVDNGIPKEVIFSSTYAWQSTSWDVAPVTLPKAVTDYVTANYKGYYIEDAEQYESPQGEYYILELEPVPSGRDIHLKINLDGTSPEVLPY